MVKKYIPKQGDVIFLNFNPTKGHEQADFRLAVVISNNVFNQNTKMVMVCPITSNDKYFPTHYNLEDTKNSFTFFISNDVDIVKKQTKNIAISNIDNLVSSLLIALAGVCKY